MKKDFVQRVLLEGIVDTKKYRYKTVYHYSSTEQHIEVKRLPIKDLGTTASIKGWVTVAKID